MASAQRPQRVSIRSKPLDTCPEPHYAGLRSGLNRGTTYAPRREETRSTAPPAGGSRRLHLSFSQSVFALSNLGRTAAHPKPLATSGTTAHGRPRVIRPPRTVQRAGGGRVGGGTRRGRRGPLLLLRACDRRKKLAGGSLRWVAKQANNSGAPVRLPNTRTAHAPGQSTAALWSSRCVGRQGRRLGRTWGRRPPQHDGALPLAAHPPTSSPPPHTHFTLSPASLTHPVPFPHPHSRLHTKQPKHHHD